MIKERYCSYELARLLKEKGFDEPCLQMWVCGPDKKYLFRLQSSCYQNITEKDSCLAPTHQMACDWLGDIHDLHIIAYPYKRGNNKGWCCHVYKTYNLLGQKRYVNETCNSCYKAIEAALKYSLEKLI